MPGTVYVDPLHRVAVAGGTHGNEMSGVFLVKHWLKHSSQLERDTVSAVPLLSNPKASEKGVRYYEKDLNRCFTLDILSAPDSPDDPYEVLRAKEINRLLGPRGSANAYDMILDLHNTTSNMGVCLIVSRVHNAVEMHACQYIQTHLPHYNPRIYVYAKPGTDLYSVDSVAKCGLGFELGPQPQGVVRADILQKMKTVIEMTLDFINHLNKGMEFPAFETDTYQCSGQVDFPRSSDGEISAVIHPSLQDKDFSLLHPGDLIFLTLDGQSIPYSGEKPIYPVFINEAAYYEKKIAFILAEKIRVSVPALRRQTH
ncbi:PREDICTED: N-acyl-aromatic-L-amino acid amidohydrolase (carboxylate-forming) [Nanorana parkeri]|uniref:N-acyl-aromatic-L-amino acid amidohydrolase (carboxylate-forming) n=1 Tax=Nanorana parkeri TaxID=125878 RepID=UPI00085490D5|nr:PREDICTED: N-acyl-aromatic-L-amino acid amidohydrolase (carboxylate-forming) [Nanorana parkeri]